MNTRKSMTLNVTTSLETIDSEGHVVIDETTEELVVYAGHYLYRMFKKPGVRGFFPNGKRSIRITQVEDGS